jgi:ribosomal protein L11 methyltransferase
MAWIEIRFDATLEAVDWVYTLLAPTTLVTQAPTIAPTPPAPPWACTLCLYWPADGQSGDRLTTLQRTLSSLQRTQLIGEFTTTRLAEKPMLAAHASPKLLGDRFTLLPADADLPQACDRLPLRLSHSLAFGSGLHPATVAMVRLIERHLCPGMATLDLGSGSGILSVAMARLGAQVTAMDNDAIAVQATRATGQLNGLTQSITVRQGSLGTGNDLGHWMGGEVGQVDGAILEETSQPVATYDLIAANILARIHIALAQDYSRALRRPGWLLTSGFTSDYADDITAALEGAGFEVGDREQIEDWVAISYTISQT